MASRRNPPSYPNQRLPFWLWALVVAMTFSISGSSAEIHLSGELGGNVTIHCPSDKSRAIEFFYFQRGNDFVNGYYGSLEIPTKPWEDTTVDYGSTTVNMSNLNVSHIGDYCCFIKYSDSQHPHKTTIHLTVTAKYSKPVVTVDCKGENQPSSCFMTCSSHGGYPRAKMSWNINRTSLLKEVNTSEMRNPHTKTFNSSSSATFNCSSGEMKHLSCSVGNVTSEFFTVCTSKPHLGTIVVAEVICALVVSIMLGLLLWYKCRKRQTRAAAPVEQQEDIVRLNIPVVETPTE